MREGCLRAVLAAFVCALSACAAAPSGGGGSRSAGTATEARAPSSADANADVDASDLVDDPADPLRPRVAARFDAPRAREDAVALRELAGGFRTRVNGREATVLEVVTAPPAMFHTLVVGDPPIAARWFGEAWSFAPELVRAVAANGTVTQRPVPADDVWRVRLTGPAGFPLGDFLGAWSGNSAGRSFDGRSAGGIRLPPVPGGGGGGWLPAARLRVEPAVGRWWIEDGGGQVVWSRWSVPTTVEVAGSSEPESAAFWDALSMKLDQRLSAGPVRVVASPWVAAFEASREADAEAAAERVLAEVLAP